MLVDEFDQAIFEHPYTFQAGSKCRYNGIWDWKIYKMVGLRATPQGNLHEIFEDVIAKSELVKVLHFKSEYKQTKK